MCRTSNTVAPYLVHPITQILSKNVGMLWVGRRSSQCAHVTGRFEVWVQSGVEVWEDVSCMEGTRGYLVYEMSLVIDGLSNLEPEDESTSRKQFICQ